MINMERNTNRLIVSRVCAILQTVLSATIICQGAAVLLNATILRVDIAEAIIAIIRIILGSLIIICAIIWIFSTCFPKSVAMNGTNMGFSIVSILAAISAVSLMSIAVLGNNKCDDYYEGLKMSDGIDRCPKVIQTQTAINNTALAISVALLGLSVLNLVLCSIRCCCNKATDQEIQIGYFQQANTALQVNNSGEATDYQLQIGYSKPVNTEVEKLKVEM